MSAGSARPSPPGASGTGSTATPTPKANEPVVRWPSTVDRARQLTVYVSSASSGSEARTWSGLPSGTSVGPVSIGAPEESTTAISESPGSGGSVKSMTISGGEICSTAPFSGNERSRTAWARAAELNEVSPAATSPATMRPRRT